MLSANTVEDSFGAWPIPGTKPPEGWNVPVSDVCGVVNEEKSNWPGSVFFSG